MLFFSHLLLALAPGSFTAAPGFFSLAPGDAARFHPADADVYIEVPDLRATRAAYANAPIVKMLRDPAVGRIADAAKEMGVDVGAILAGMMPKGDPAHPDDRFWPWSAVTSLSMSVAGLDALASAGTSWSVRASGWIVIDFADEAAAAQGAEAIAATPGVTKVAVQNATPTDSAASGATAAPVRDEPAPEETVQIDAAKVRVARHEIEIVGSKLSFWLARPGARIVCGFGRARPEDLVERLAKPENGFNAKHAALVKDTGLQAPCGVTIARAWSDLERIPLPIEDALSAELADLAVAEFAPFVGQRGAHRLQLCNDRFVWESLTEWIGPAKQLDELYGAAPIPPTTARFLPKEAVGVWLLKIKPARIEALMQRVLAHVESAGGPATATKPSVAPASFAAAMGESAAVFQMPFSMGNMSQEGVSPNTLVAIELKDAAAFQPAFEAWIAHVKTLDPTLQVENKPYHKLPTYTFTHASAAKADEKASESAIRPTLVVMSDRILLAPNRKYAQSEVRRIEGPKDEAHPLAADGAIPKDAYEVSWMDWGSLIGKTYDMARGLLPLLAQSTGKASIDASKLPTSAELFHDFLPSISTTTRIDGKQYRHAVTSFGPETPLGALALAAGISIYGHKTASMIAESAAVLPGAEPTKDTVTPGWVVDGKSGELVPADKVAPQRTATLTALRDVKTGLAVYRSQLGRVPDTLDELLKATDAFPNGFLDGGVVPKDGWNHALVYSAQDKGAKYDLRSCGPNGVDDHGTGDDVSAP